MKSLPIFNWGRGGRALIALVLAVAALAILLLGVGNELPTAWASDLPPARPEVTAALTSYVYLPFIWRAPTLPQNVVFADEFNSTGSGWIRGEYKDFSDRLTCKFNYDTSAGVYRVTATNTDDNYRYNCNLYNTKIPRQFYGTFIVKARRTSSTNAQLYGFQFDTGQNSTDASGVRWALEVYPKSDSQCNNDPFFWLTAMKSGTVKFTNANASDKHQCTDAIDTDRNDWNELAAVRSGTTVKVFIRRAGDSYSHRYSDVPRFSSDEATKYGYFQLRVSVLPNSTVTVEYDRVEIRSSVSDPW